MPLLGVGDTLLPESFTRTTSLQALSHIYIPFSVLLTLFVIGFLYWWRDASSPSSSNSKAPSHCYCEDKPEVIIVGAGVVGSAMAVVLGREGRHVVVIERDMKEPDRIVGELLQPGGVMVLQELGLADCLQDIDAHTIRGYVIHNACSASSLKVPYPTEGNGVCEGRALHHGRFIMRLREAMLQQPTVRVIEGTVGKLMEEGDTVIGVRYQQKGSDESEEMFAPLTIVADGCFSRFRRQLLHECPTVKSHFVGFLMHNCPQAETNHAELVLCEPSPVLIYQISSTCTRVLVDVRGATLPKDIRHYLREHIYPQLPGHIKGPFAEGMESDRLRSMPNSYLPPVPIVKRGVLCLGDAVNMRHPLTGGGMTVGLSDVKMARHLFSRIEDFAEHKLLLRAVRALYFQRKHQHSFVVNVLAQALYELFAADDEHLWKMKHACFEYFQLGGACVSGPVGLLSILEPKPYILIGHFFAVALYAVYITVRKAPLMCLHRSILASFCIIQAACKVIFPLVWSELKTIVRPCN